MFRRMMAAWLVLALFSIGVSRSINGDDSVRLVPEKADRALVVKVRVPSDEEYGKVADILDKVKARGATSLKLQVSKAGETASAEVAAFPKTPSKRVAAVVEALLDCGIKKIAVEVTK